MTMKKSSEILQKLKNDEISNEQVWGAFSPGLRKSLTSLNPLTFARCYLPHVTKVDSPPFHREMVSAAMKYPRCLFLAPRDHAKSSLFSVIYPLWKICLDPNIRIHHIADTQKQSYKYLSAIKYELENNQMLIDDYGPFVGEPWQGSQFVVERTINSKDPTMSGYGFGSTQLGDRSDLIICDDIISRDDCFSETQREKSRWWFKEVLTNFLEEDGGQIIVIGTLQHDLDLYNEIINDGVYFHKLYRAVLDWDKKKVLWEDKWDWDSLMARMDEIKSVAFHRQFQNEVISEADSIFPIELLEPALDRSFEFLNIYEERPTWLSDMQTFLGVDLATSANVGADYFVCFTLGVDEFGNRKVLHIFRKRGVSFSNQANKILDLHKFFSYDKIMIENNQYQDVLPGSLKNETDLPVKGYQTGAERSTKQIGVPSIRVLFENGKYSIPYGPRSRRLADKYVHELHSLSIDEDDKITTSAGHKDIVMANWLAEIGSRETPNYNRFKVIRRSR